MWMWSISPKTSYCTARTLLFLRWKEMKKCLCVIWDEVRWMIGALWHRFRLLFTFCPTSSASRPRLITGNWNWKGKPWGRVNYHVNKYCRCSQNIRQIYTSWLRSQRWQCNPEGWSRDSFWFPDFRSGRAHSSLRRSVKAIALAVIPGFYTSTSSFKQFHLLNIFLVKLSRVDSICHWNSHNTVTDNTVPVMEPGLYAGLLLTAEY